MFAGACFHTPKWCEICLPRTATTAEGEEQEEEEEEELPGRLREEEQKQEEGLKSFGGEDGEEGGYGEAD